MACGLAAATVRALAVAQRRWHAPLPAPEVNTHQRLELMSTTSGAVAPVIAVMARRPASRFSSGEWPPGNTGQSGGSRRMPAPSEVPEEKSRLMMRSCPETGLSSGAGAAS